MSIRITQFFKISIAVAALFAAGDAFSAQAPNPRGGASAAATTAVARGDARDNREVKRTGAAVSGVSSGAASRSATRRPGTTVVRTAGVVPSSARSAVSARSAATPRAGTSSVNSTSTVPVSLGRAASGSVVRAAAHQSAARSATVAGASRASNARATAVFEDVTAIGGGYAACREAYATCMDQFCAKANDTYRRCFCSAKFEEFRDTEAALDQAKTLLMQFEDNNLNAVDKTAAEVNAMYSATVGEQAIKNDTSAAANTLSEIGELLSGKKKADASNNSGTSLGILSLDLTDGLDDIWSGGGSSLFETSAGQDLSTLEGQKLFNSANNQCLKLVAESCENNAVLTMARSAYNILITQDCNAYEKKINSQKETVAKTAREAEKILRDARLEEYRAHNSADVNECIAKVKSALTQETACGANYKRCMDYSGAYIDVNTGEAIYSPRLFELTDMIILNGGSDVLGANPRFAQFLDSKKMFATAALDTCRDISDIVWQEFKRSALIEIAQAQDAKIEEIKSTCVSTMAECYDTQSGALKSFDNTTSQYSGATAAYAARSMCQDKVAACAALYAGPNDTQCQFDANGRLTNGATCGLKALVDFVQTVDNVRVAEGCDTALTNYVTDLCTPNGDKQQYPWNCRLMSKSDLEANLRGRANMYCKDPATGNIDEAVVGDTIDRLISEVETSLYELMEEQCESDEISGLCVDKDDAAGETREQAFYTTVFNNSNSSVADDRGVCIQNTVKYQCMAQDDATGGKGYAKFVPATNTCDFTVEWYQIQCSKLGGYWENNMCYI